MAGTPLTDSIEALTAYANQVTGASDTNLSDAVYTLAQGYSGGETPKGNIQALITHGNEWVNTNLLIDSTKIFVFDGIISTYHQYDYLFGLSGGSSIRACCQYSSDTSLNIPFWYSNANFSFFPTIGERFTVIVGGNFNYITAARYTATKPLLIFAGYYQEIQQSARFKGYFYGLELIDYTTRQLAYNFVPWLDSNDVPCIKDTVHNQLYYNSGTGGFDYLDNNGNIITM